MSHPTLPLLFANVPSKHGKHPIAPEEFEKKPEGQLEHCVALAASLAYKPDIHSRQLNDPGSDATKPVGQPMHSMPCVKEPVGQRVYEIKCTGSLI